MTTPNTANKCVYPSEELLPCPFCGCKEIDSITDDGAHWNKCTGCGATGPMTTRYSGEEGEEYASWQSRPRYTSLLLELSDARKVISALRSPIPQEGGKHES